MRLSRSSLLEGVRVVELAEEVAGPYAGRLLRAAGAGVVKIEQLPHGDPARGRPPFAGKDGTETSLSFLYLNAGKKSVALDPGSSQGREAVEGLLARADILIIDRPASQMEALGLPYPELSTRFPQLVTVAVRPFGLSGPGAELRARALNVYHASGMGFITRRRNEEGDTGPPMRAAGYQADYFAALHAASSALAGLYHRRASGVGQLIELSQQELLMALIYNPLAYYYYEERVIGLGKEPQQAGGILPCRDGYVLIGSNEERFWEGLIRLMGNPEWAEGGWWRDAESRFINRDFLNGHLLEWLKDRTMREVNEQCQNAHLPVGILNRPKDVAEDRQLNARGFFELWHDPLLGPVRMPGLSFMLQQEEPPVSAPAPYLGEHTAEVLSELGWDAAAIANLRAAEAV